MRCERNFVTQVSHITQQVGVPIKTLENVQHARELRESKGMISGLPVDRTGFLSDTL
jgi:hypothetical protein